MSILLPASPRIGGKGLSPRMTLDRSPQLLCARGDSPRKPSCRKGDELEAFQERIDDEWTVIDEHHLAPQQARIRFDVVKKEAESLASIGYDAFCRGIH